MVFKKNGFSRVVAVAISATMIFGSSIVALADGDTTTTAGTGNILAYNSDTYIVPTTMKVALNPNGLPVNVRYTKAESYVAGTTYYTKSDDTYTVADIKAFAANTDYYTATQVATQVVSFNYGIVNTSTKDRTITVTLEVSGSGTASTAEGAKDIVFVDSAAKATAVSDSNEDGAAFGDLKMFLTVAPSTAAPTAATYKKTTDTTVGSGKTYYTKSGTTYTAAENLTAFAENTVYYEADTVIGVEIQASELADVTMTPVAAAKQTTFTAGDSANTASAEIAYKLGKATYSPKKGEIIDFDTTQTALANKVELSAIGGTAAFTITGTMNTNTDWIKAKYAALTITPTYEVADDDGSATVLEDGGFNQIATTPAVVAVTATPASFNAETSAAVITHIPEGATLSDVKYQKADGTYATIASGNHYSWDAETSTFTVLKTALNGESFAGAKWILTFGEETVEIPVVAE